jgi:hypothetical protein
MCPLTRYYDALCGWEWLGCRRRVNTGIWDLARIS